MVPPLAPCLLLRRILIWNFHQKPHRLTLQQNQNAVPVQVLHRKGKGALKLLSGLPLQLRDEKLGHHSENHRFLQLDLRDHLVPPLISKRRKLSLKEVEYCLELFNCRARKRILYFLLILY